MGVPVLVVSGSMGAGKTVVAEVAGDLLSAAGVAHAVVDLDGLAWGHWPSRDGAVGVRNLEAVWANYARAGAARLLVACAVETRDGLDRIARAIPGSETQVCRLVASLREMERRVAGREHGPLRDRFVERVAVLETILDAAALEDFAVSNEGRPVEDVAREVLARAGWLPG